MRLKYGSTLSLAGELAVITGGSGIDYVYASAGTSVDFTNGGGGADMLYLDGAFASYTKSVVGILDKISGQPPLTNTFTTGGSYTVDTTYNTTVVAAAGEDLTLDSGETAAHIFVDASKLAAGDTLTLSLSGGATLASQTVTAGDITAGGLTLTVLKSALVPPRIRTLPNCPLWWEVSTLMQAMTS